MRRTRSVWIGAMVVLLVALFAVTASATVSEMYFASDPNGQNRVTNIQEGDEIWICVYDPDQNIDADFPDKMWLNLMVFDPKTGACILWDNGGYTGIDGDLAKDYLEETGIDTGLFVSNRAFRIGGRTSPTDWTHDPGDFSGGADLYIDGIYTQLEVSGRVENMDTLVGMYQDPNDGTDVAVSLLKIIDTEATISWDQMIYADQHTSATITIVDLDENLDVNEVEYVPVFIIVNPGSWNPVRENSATNFCMLKRYGGVDPATGNALNNPMRWHNIYNGGLGSPYPNNDQPTDDGAYYLEYPTPGDGNVVSFDTADPNGFCRVMFYARENGNDTGVFQLHMNDILDGLGLNSLDVRDVLAAYYLDPNDFDDFKLATAYIGEHQHSITSFTDAAGVEQPGYWIGRDSVYVQVIDSNANVDPGSPEQVVVHICDPHGEDDAEWIILDETSSNSPVFFLSDEALTLLPVWNALGWEDPGPGGYGLQLDNWELEVYNEDSIYVRYNDVYYKNDVAGMAGLGDANTATAFPPEIVAIRVNNDVSFDLAEVADTQVYDGDSVNMYFLNRYGDRVSCYTNSDCVFIEVVDPDQNEQQDSRDRVDGFWDDHQNGPLGPMDFEDNHGSCGYGYNDVWEHPVNSLLGDTNIFAGGYSGNPSDSTSWAEIYVLNPRNGRWAAVDLLETGVNTGHFVNVSCVDLISVYESVPTLGVLPGDTIIAVYQDPSNHSDTAWISIKIGLGGPQPGGPSTTTFANSVGMDVDSYTEYENIYVKVVDPSHTGATNILNAVELDGVYFDLTPLPVAPNDTFITGAISQEALGISVGDSITATYTDPINPADISSDTVSTVAVTCATVCSNLTPAGWQMIALPGDLSGCPCGDEYGNLCCAICDDLDPCYIFRYDPLTGGYVMLPPCEAIDYQAGMGFWVRTYEDPVEICADVRLVMDARCIPLEPGWNQIGNPFPFEVPLGNLVVRYQESALSLEQAQVNGWVSMYLFSYNPATGGYEMVYPPDGVLRPWTGYWIRAYVNCEICIPPIPAPPTPPSALIRPMDLDLKDIPTPPPPPSDPMEAIGEDLVTELIVRNIPNPVRSEHTTTFKVEGKAASLVQAIRVEIYDLSGQRVFTQEIAAKELEWHTVNKAGELLANGVYLYQVWVRIGDTWHPTGVRKLAVCR